MSVKKFLCLSSFVLVLCGLFDVSAAEAQDFGVRVGASVDPEQFYFGGHVESEPIYEQLIFRPNIEIGFGDNLTIVGLNGEFVWPFELATAGSLYAGFGPAINVISVDAGVVSDTTVKPGINFLGGYEFDQGYFVEIKLGAIDSPDLKFGIGYTWGQ